MRSGAKDPILPARIGSPASSVGATTTQSASVFGGAPAAPTAARSFARINYHRHYPVWALPRVRFALDAVGPALDGSTRLVCGGEEIAVPRHRLQIHRPVRVGFDLLAQVHHVPPDQPVVA